MTVGPSRSGSCLRHDPRAQHAAIGGAANIEAYAETRWVTMWCKAYRYLF
jgi:hypothetical protein